METLYFKPLWRDYDQDVPLEMVCGPTKEWLAAVTPLIRTMRVIRFAVLQNGEILVGDAYTVLHRDLARCGRRLRDESNDDDYVEPLIGASLVHDG